MLTESYRKQLYARLVEKILVDANGCWIWQGNAYRNRKYAANRYGYISIWYADRGKSISQATHRAMWISVHGELTRDQHVCHRCDVPLCCNPEHLFIGTHKDNMADSKQKGRHFLSSKTHCKRGHPLSGDNVYVCKTGLRHCKRCQTARWRIRQGWPKDLAYEIGRVPFGYSREDVLSGRVPDVGVVPSASGGPT